LIVWCVCAIFSGSFVSAGCPVLSGVTHVADLVMSCLPCVRPFLSRVLVLPSGARVMCPNPCVFLLVFLGLTRCCPGPYSRFFPFFPFVVNVAPSVCSQVFIKPLTINVSNSLT